MPNRIDISNQIFTFLTAIKATKLREASSGSIIWQCKCICSKKLNVSARCLRSGNTKSCGCKRGEMAGRGISKRLTQHGAAYKSKQGGAQLDYTLWQGIKRRCYNVNDRSYERYGGRGIFLSKKWKENFGSFAEYIRTLPNCPSEKILTSRGLGKRLKVSLDRIENEKSYVKGNIKWSTKTQQARNTRSNIFYKFRDRFITLPEIAEIVDIPYGKLYNRINKLNKTLKQAIALG